MSSLNESMSATSGLRRDHEVIMKVLSAMDLLRMLLRQGREVPVDIIRDTIDFAKNFTDRCHHGKEEDVLFPALNAAGMPRDEGPIAVMLREHRQGREILERIEGALARYMQGSSSIDEVMGGIEDYTMLMQHHIFKENNILFNMADMVLAGRRDELNQGYSRIEREVMRERHGYYERMADDLLGRMNAMR
ncbi:MAG: hemerythrin domain-containing protein [Candidatus Nitrosocaldus sp.]|nr:hemerythrin domain-containing protein [Candidatus Nitrosocaldus sp.]MDW8000120.1 hemerythrin domain-containing protein [Candidatus Nitrosocaldus sp.]